MDGWLDYLCPAAIGVAFLASVPWGRRVWWMVDAAASGIFGLGLILVPQIILGFQVTGRLDSVHMMLARGVGAFLLGHAVHWFLARESIDLRMYGTQFFCRLIGCTFLLISQLYSAYHLWNRKGIRFNEKWLCFSCAGVGFWLLGSVLQLLRYQDIGGYVYKPSWHNTGFLLDHLAMLVVGVVSFAFPSQILKLLIKSGFTIDGVHVCLLRVLASFLICVSMSSNSAPGTLYQLDKRAHILGRLTTQVLIFAMNLYAHFVLDIYTMYNVTPFMLCGFYITFLLSIYFRIGKEKES